MKPFAGNLPGCFFRDICLNFPGAIDYRYFYGGEGVRLRQTDSLPALA